MCIIHCDMALCHLHWYLDNQAIDYMSQYVDWTATPVSMWIYGNVWECEWKWCVDKVVVISVSIIRLVHTQMILVAAPANDRYRRDSLRRMCFVACLSRKKNCRDKNDTCTAPPNETCHAHSFAKREKAVTEDWRFCCQFALEAGWFTVRTCNCLTVVVSSLLFFRFSFFFSPKYETLVHSLATTKLTQFVFLISCNPLRPIV